MEETQTRTRKDLKKVAQESFNAHLASRLDGTLTDKEFRAKVKDDIIAATGATVGSASSAYNNAKKQAIEDGLIEEHQIGRQAGKNNGGPKKNTATVEVPASTESVSEEVKVEEQQTEAAE